MTDPVSANPLAEAPIARFESAVASVRGEMVVIGGHMEPHLAATTSNLSFDPSTGIWRRRMDAPRALSHLTAAVVDDRHVWLVGGYEGAHPGVGIRASYRYDALEDRWEDGPPLPSIRASGGLGLIGRRLHFFGGIDADRSTNRDDHWSLDVDNPLRWERSAPMPMARTHAATAVIDGCIYAIGGHFGHDIPGRPGDISWEPDLDLVHRYDPVADRWDEVAPLTRRRSHCEPSTFVKDGLIVCMGGRNNAPTARCRCEKTLLSHYYRRAVRKLDILRGRRSAEMTLDDIIAYDPARDRWLDLGRMPRPLYAPAATNVNGRIIVANGGTKGWQHPSAETFTVDPVLPR